MTLLSRLSRHCRMENGMVVLLDEPITHEAIGSMYAVHNKLGYGFLEHPYLGALEYECRRRGLTVEREVRIEIQYEGIVVGAYRVDLFLNRRVIVEVKTCAPHQDHEYQLLNYLRCSQAEVGLLMYFRRSATFKRLVFRNELKQRHASVDIRTSPGLTAPGSDPQLR